MKRDAANLLSSHHGQVFKEATLPVEALREHSRLPHVPGIAVGDIVFSSYGRPMRVECTNEFVCLEHHAFGPYCALQALDDKNCRVIWPRSWYTQRGEQLALFNSAKGS